MDEMTPHQQPLRRPYHITLTDSVKTQLCLLSVVEQHLRLAALRLNLEQEPLVLTPTRRPLPAPLERWWVLRIGPYDLMYIPPVEDRTLTLIAVGHQ